MKITSVNVRKIEKEGSRMKGIASVLLDDSLELPNKYSLIEGTPKHVPITTEHPSTPLIKGTKNPLPKPKFAFSFFTLTVFTLPGFLTVLKFDCFSSLFSPIVSS